MKSVYRKPGLVYFIGAVLLCMLGTPNFVTAQSDEVIPTGIAPLSKRISLMSFPLSVYPFVRADQGVLIPSRRFQELVEVKVLFEDRTDGRVGLDVNEDFLPMQASALSSGLALYKESGAQPDGFNFLVGDQNSDTAIDLIEPPTVEPVTDVPGSYIVTFRPVSGSVRLSTFMDQFPDFYIVGQTSLNLLQGDRFQVSIPANGITILDRTEALPDNTVFDDSFPNESFRNLNPLFADPFIYEGDIVELSSTINEADNTNRVDASSEPTSVIGIDMVGREDQGYFLEEVRVNWIGINLGQIARLMANRSQPGYSTSQIAGAQAAAQVGQMQKTNFVPSFFYSPWFYNYPLNAETGELLSTVTVGSDDQPIPLTFPLDYNGSPRGTFALLNDDLNSHVTGYVPFGPRQVGTDGLQPRVIGPDIFLPFRSGTNGGVFLYRELGGTKGKYDKGVDQIITLDESKFRIETFGITAEDVQDYSSPIRSLIRRLVPGVVAERSAVDTVSFLFGDDNLGAELLGVSEMPDPSSDFRPPFGTLACYDDPDCLFFDLMINVLQPYLGLTEGQIRYLFEYTEENGITNMEELFGFPIVQGFSFVMPVARNNAISNLKVPSSRTGQSAGAEVYVGIRTSDQLRSLDSFVPFIRPEDIKVGTNVSGFTKSATENVESLGSVSSVGYGRPDSDETFTLLGRPKPRFQFQDLTQPGEGALQADNNNILFDSSLGSPPKAVIGINAVDFGQNTNLVFNNALIPQDNFDIFFSEASVLGEMQIDFLPGTQSAEFDPAILAAIPVQLGVDLPFSRVVSDHSVALYVDDDTPFGDGIDNDGDGLVDEELFNLIDDDGDGLIDEDFGDGSPAGTNGVFDSFDRFLPATRDNRGTVSGFGDATYVFPPNDQTKYQQFITAIEPADDPFTIDDGGLLPLNVSEGSWFAELDMRALNFNVYNIPSSNIFPPQSSRLGVSAAAAPEFDPPLYNQGTFPVLDPVTGLVDLVPALRARGGDFGDFPYYPDDLFVEDPTTGDIIWLLDITLETGDDTLAPLVDPDGDVRRTFALTVARGLRFPNPEAFVRVGHVPMVVNVGGPNGQDPEGEGLDTTNGSPYYQFGFFINLAQDGFQDYINSVADSLSSAYDSARDTKADFEQSVADAEASAAEADPPEDPQYPDLPDPIAITVPDPYDSLGITEFLNTATYQTNYEYQLQIPDENFGPLAGNDYFVVIRASDNASVGDTFRVRIRSGERDRMIQNPDPNAAANEQQIPAPEGGVGYHSFVKTDYTSGRESFRNISKNQVTTNEIVVRSANVAPRIQFFSPTSGLNVASQSFDYDILFQAEDPDNVAQIRLFVDTDSLNYDGHFIPGAILREGFDTSFTINLQDDIENFDPTQDYFIYAEVTDGVNAPVLVYADGGISTQASVDQGQSGSGSGGTRTVINELDNPLDYIKVSDDGRFFALGDAPLFEEITTTERVVDIEKPANNSGALILQSDGQVYGTGTIGVFQRLLQPNNTLQFAPERIAFLKNRADGAELIVAPDPSQIEIENARDMEVDFVNGAIYILDGDGDMLYLGAANTNLRPEPVGIDLYRDMELSVDGSTLYFLTGNGILTTSGARQLGEFRDIIPEDKYRDIEKIVSGADAVGLVIIDDDGNIHVVGSDPGNVASLKLSADDGVEPGTIRQVKMFPGELGTLMLVEGSGQVHVLSHDQVLTPSDGFVFADQPGLDDDRIVDTETASINLQAVVGVVEDILKAISSENVSGVMKHVDPSYMDRSGNDYAGLQKSLTSMFDFYEIISFSRSISVDGSFTVSTQGDEVIAQVYIDFSAFRPTIDYIVPQVDASTQTTEFQATQLFQGGVPFDQTMRIRDVSDGRSWTIELWEIRNYGLKTQDLADSEDLEFQDVTFLTSQTDNKRIGFYAPKSEGIDAPMLIPLDRNDADSIQPLNVMAIFRENYRRYDVAPPALEYTTYLGNSFGSAGFDQITFRFKQDQSGQPRLTSMNLRQYLLENPQSFDTLNQQLVITSLDGNQIDDPFGFSFKRRGATLTAFPGDSDVVLSADQLVPTSSLGAIMMLPENTDIFSLNPVSLIDTLSRTTVDLNPFDPQADTLNQDNTAQGATALPGRSYLVITSDGTHYGFIQIPPDIDDPTTTSPASLSFDYRYEDSFVLPPNF